MSTLLLIDMRMAQAQAIGMDMNKTRIKNLNALVEKYGSQARLAEKLDMSTGYIGQLAVGHRPITEKTARKFEQILRLKKGFMDSLDEKQDDSKINSKVLALSLEKVRTATKDMSIDATETDLAVITALIYEIMIEDEGISDKELERLLRARTEN